MNGIHVKNIMREFSVFSGLPPIRVVLLKNTCTGVCVCVRASVYACVGLWVCAWVGGGGGVMCACVRVCEWSYACICVCLCMHVLGLVYRSCVLSILLYRAETWCVKQCHLHHSDVFHRSCVRCILGISRTAQWHEHLSSAALAQRAGLPHDISTLLRE